MKRLLTTIVLLLLSVNLSFGQIELLGPESAKTGELVRIRATKFEGDDPKVICVPANNDWEALKNLENQLVVLLSTRAKGKYTFFFATNSGGKTHVAFHTVVIEGDGTTPDVNVPDVPKPDTQLKADLTAAYMVSPDKAALGKLINVYSEVQKSNKEAGFDNFGTAQTVLRGAVEANELKWQDLRAVRDQVEKYLVAKCGKDAKAYNKELLDKTLGEIIATLKTLPQ